MDIKERRKDASKVQENYCGHHAMPKFAQVNAAFLKKTMLPRAPDCYFTPEDVALINHETGLEPAVILHWACNLLENEELNNEFKLGAGVASVEAYLKASEESLAQMVSLSREKRLNFFDVLLALPCRGFGIFSKAE